MKKPTINDHPKTDSRTFLNIDGTVNWRKYAYALDAYIADHVVEVPQPEKEELFEKVYVDGKEENLPKEAGSYIVCKKNGDMYNNWSFISIDDKFPDAKMWLRWMDWWLRPVKKG